MSDVFISYAREDREKAELLARAFAEQKWTIWWDKVIPPGRKYADVIGEELASAKAVIVLWSQASVASDWVKDEAQEGANRRVLVPVLVEKVNPPYGFRQVQTADLSDWDGSSSHAELQSLISGVGSLISKPVSASTQASHRPDSGKRRKVLFLLAGGALILLLAYGAYRFILRRGGNQNQNQRVDVGNQNNSGTARCDSESRKKAVDYTSKGLLMIDPGGNYNAAELQFTEATKECPEYTDAYFWRGQSYVALQDKNRAVLDFKTVVEIATDAGMRQKAQKFLADIEGPLPTPSPVPTNTNKNTNTNTSTNTNTNTSGSNVNANTSTNQGSTEPVQVQVKELFAADKSTRIAATTRLIIGKKNHEKAVGLSVESALANPKDKSGVINTLVFLESVDPVILKQHRKAIEKLLAVAKDNGEQTAAHVRKVEALLNQ